MGNFDVRGSADVKHNVYSESWSFMGQHTHRSANTHFGPRAQRSISVCSFHVRWHPLRYWVVCVCVSWKSFCNAHPPCHGLRNPIHTVHVQMIFFTPLHGVQTPFPPNFFRLPNHLFSLSRCSYICIPHKMFLHFRELWLHGLQGSLQRSPIKCFNILLQTFWFTPTFTPITWFTPAFTP